MLSSIVTKSHYLEFTKKKGSWSIPLMRGFSIGFFIGVLYILANGLWGGASESGRNVWSMINAGTFHITVIGDMFILLATIIVLMFGICIAAFLWDRYLSSRQKHGINVTTKDGLNIGKAVFGFSDEGVSVRFQNSSKLIKWSQQAQIKETKNLFTLVARDGRLTLIPKSAFTSDVEYENIKAYAKAMISGEKVSSDITLKAQPITDPDLVLDKSQFKMVDEIVYRLSGLDWQIYQDRLQQKRLGGAGYRLKKTLLSATLLRIFTGFLLMAFFFSLWMQLSFGQVNLINVLIMSGVIAFHIRVNRDKLIPARGAYARNGMDPNHAQNTVHTLTIFEEGLLHQTEGQVAMLDWRGVIDIEQNDGAFYIMTTQSSGIIIPRMAFLSRAAEVEFINILHLQVRGTRLSQVSSTQDILKPLPEAPLGAKQAQVH